MTHGKWWSTVAATIATAVCCCALTAHHLQAPGALTHITLISELEAKATTQPTVVSAFVGRVHPLRFCFLRRLAILRAQLLLLREHH